MNNEKTGKLIAKARKEKNLTQQQLGDIIGIGSKAVSKWERGLTFPDISILKILSETLEISVEELINGETKRKRTEKIKSENKLFKKIIILFLALLILVLIYSFKNKQYTYSIVSGNDDIYLEGNITFDRNNISIIISNLEFKNNELSSTKVINYEYDFTVNENFIFRYGYFPSSETIDKEITIGDLAKQFNVNFSSETEIKRNYILDNNIILTIRFLKSNNDIVSKDINILITK